MITIFCMLVGVAGDAFSVNFDNSETVGDLKNAIKMKNPNKIQCDANKLHLYLAKRDNEWLPYNSTELQALKTGDNSLVKDLLTENSELEPMKKINVVFEDLNDRDEVIHVLVVDLKLEAIYNISGNYSLTWLDEFREKYIEYHSLPSISSLRNFIKQDIPVKIPIARNVLNTWRVYIGGGNIDIINKMFINNDTITCKKIETRIEYILDPLPTGDTDSSFHTFWDVLILSILNLVFTDGRVNRYSFKNLRTEKKRPDFVFFLNNVCIIRGEEDDPGVNIRKPRDKLAQKMIWNHGIVPYLFGYAASGYSVDLVAFTCSDNDSVVSFPIGSFYLKSIAERFRLVLALLNLCLLFPAITEACPESGHDEYKDIYQYNGIIIRLNPTSVEKCIPDKKVFQHVQDIYAKMKEVNVPNVDRLIEVKFYMNEVIFEPRGLTKKPSNLLELFIAIRNVLEALLVLHNASLMHRDIRWPNVIKRHDMDAWFLIDFTDAATNPPPNISGEPLSTEEHAPEIFIDGGTHTTAVDMWGVGYLIDTSNVRWYTPKRADFVTSLMDSDPLVRPNAEVALQKWIELEEEAKEELLCWNNFTNFSTDTQTQTRI